MRLGRRIKRQRQRANPIPPGAQKAATEQLLRGVPHLHPSVARIRDKKHGFALTWTSEYKGKEPPQSWLGRLWRGPPRKHMIALDVTGRRVVELIDGRRDLQSIAATIAADIGGQPKEVREATLTFVTQLARRNIVILDIAR